MSYKYYEYQSKYKAKYNEDLRHHAVQSISSGQIIDLWVNIFKRSANQTKYPYSENFTSDIIFSMLLKGCFYCGQLATGIDPGIWILYNVILKYDCHLTLVTINLYNLKNIPPNVKMDLTFVNRVIFPNPRGILRNAVQEFTKNKSCRSLYVEYYAGGKILHLEVGKFVQDETNMVAYYPQNDQLEHIHLSVVADRIEKDAADMIRLKYMTHSYFHGNEVYDVREEEAIKKAVVDEVTAYLGQKCVLPYIYDMDFMEVYFMTGGEVMSIRLNRPNGGDVLTYSQSTYTRKGEKKMVTNLHITEIIPKILLDMTGIEQLLVLEWKWTEKNEFKHDYLIAEKISDFWHHTKEELIQRAWAPGRHIDWCLSTDEKDLS